ncbi:MAG TPA: hypothetical protein VMG12_44955 [Polyangiaceae bacterium]|nr:hypothetical protein [Polyangiaceae bacterium]
MHLEMKPSALRRRACALLAGASILFACQSDARRAEQARIANLAERIDRLRRADNPDKRALLDELKKAECVGPDACGLKDLCVRGYEVHQRALDAIQSLKHEAARDAGAPSPAVRERLLGAERDLAEAVNLSQQCADEQVKAVRKTLL